MPLITPADEAFVSRKIQQLDLAKVRAWLTERQENCWRRAGERQGNDRKGWLEDVAYFSAAIGLLELAKRAGGTH
jgi:hypothetical protein